jgi:DNA-binding response OmpR family regulator
MAKVLVIDDEPAIVRFLVRALEADGYMVASASNGAEGLRLAAEQRPDLVVLDLVMPGLSGVAVLAALVAQDPGCKVVVVSAQDDVEGKVRCLDAGAVDFVGKPFAVAELLARVRSRLRAKAPAEPTAPETELHSGVLRLDLRTRRLSNGAREVDLSQREFALMQHLMRRVGAVCTRAELLSDVWGYAFDPGSNVVDVTVARLRGKLRDLNIETIRNVGYVLREA